MLVKLKALGVETTHTIWSQRCNIVHECVILKVKGEDYHHPLLQVKELCDLVETEETNLLEQCKYKLNRVSTKTLRDFVLIKCG